MKRDLKKIIIGLFVLLFVCGEIQCVQRMTERVSTHRTRRSLKVPTNFGKTNFIIGLPSEYLQERSAAKNSSVDQSCVNEAYFSPDDDLQKKLIDYINQEQEGIYLAIFSFTDKAIAGALSAAHQRGVHVEVVVDAGFLSDRFTKIPQLQECGISIYLYDPTQSPKTSATYSNIMHNKFVLFVRNRNNQSLVWTGSFNFTKSARLSNQENVVVLSNADIVTKFKEQFTALKKRTILYNPRMQNTVQEMKKIKNGEQ